MTKTILFYDGVYPNYYNQTTLENQPMGGTEATVLRVSKGLEDRGYDVIHLQRPTIESDPIFSDHVKIHVVITLRDAGHYIANQKRWPNAKHFLWLHDVVGGDYGAHLRMHLKGQEGTILTVSDYHKGNVLTELHDVLKDGKIRVKRVYNPLADYCVNKGLGWVEGTTEDGSPWKFPPFHRHKLVYFSSPHKGLDYVLKLFGYLRNIDPTFELYIANPGYYKDYFLNPTNTLPDGVINLGKLTHRAVVEHVRSALCVFYPNTVFAETFGLVYAEANAVGTPVIAHPIGAAREVLSHPHEVLDCRDYKAVVDRVIKWSKGERPIVSARKEFRLDSVIAEWIKLLS